MVMAVTPISKGLHLRLRLFMIIIMLDMLCIQQVREKMARQWDEDIVRSKLAKRVTISVNKLDNELSLMKKVRCPLTQFLT